MPANTLVRVPPALLKSRTYLGFSEARDALPLDYDFEIPESIKHPCRVDSGFELVARSLEASHGRGA